MRLRLCVIGPAHSIHIQRWVRAFAEREDYDVTLISPYGPPQGPVKLGTTRVIWMKALLSQDQPIVKRQVRILGNWMCLRALLFKNRFDLVHVHQLPPPITALFFWRVPRLLVSAWGSDILGLPHMRPNPFHRWSRRFLLRQALAITATSRFLARETGRLAPTRLTTHVVPFGVDIKWFEVDGQHRPSGPPVRIAVTKGLKRHYGIHHLINAMEQIRQVEPRVILAIAGSGDQEQALRTQAYELRVENVVEFLGHLTPQGVTDLLRASHVYVMPSLSESFGVAALEAQAAGLPVVASKVGGVPEVVLDGQTGFLVPPGDVDALAGALLRLVRDAALRDKMGRRGQAFVRRNYDWNTCVEEMAKVYQGVLQTL